MKNCSNGEIVDKRVCKHTKNKLNNNNNNICFKANLFNFFLFIVRICYATRSVANTVNVLHSNEYIFLI